MFPKHLRTFNFTHIDMIKIKLIENRFILVIFLIILPILIDVFYIRIYGVNVVYWDQWGFVLLIDKFYNNNLSFNDFWAQNNEHRPVFARIIMLIAMYLTHYDNVAEMYISCVVVSLTLSILFMIYIQRFGFSLKSLVGFLPVSWLLFDFRQYDVILKGWSIHIFLAVLGLILAIFSLKNAKKIDRMFILAILGGLLSSFSFLTGLLVWPVGLLHIVISKTNKISLGASWSLAGVVISYLYFSNWAKPRQTPVILYSIENPLTGIAYMFIYIGSLFGVEIHSDIVQLHGITLSGTLFSYIFVIVSFGFGFLIASATIFSIISVIRNDLVEETSDWIALITFSFASAIMTALGRAGFGLEQALSSRYVAFSLLGIIGLYLVVLKLKDIKNKKYKILYRIILCMLVIGLAFGYVAGIFVGEKISESREKMAFSVIHYANASDEQLKIIYPNPRTLRDRAIILEKYGLNVFYKNSLSYNLASIEKHF
jgi:hypothetical protein